MYEFIAFVWNPLDTQLAETARTLGSRLLNLRKPWEVVYQRNGLYALQAGSRPGSLEAFHLDGNHGVVLGSIFHKSTYKRLIAGPRSFTGETSDALLRTKGRSLIDDFWGKYVAFLNDEGAQEKHVIADPSAGLPCLFSSFNGISLFYSRPQIWLALGLPAFSVNWDYIAAHIALGATHTRECGLREVSELIGGECISINATRTKRQLYWEPMKYCQSGLIESIDEAVEQLRSTLDGCIGAWASCHTGILHTLSGGLDSSIVLSSLSRADSRPRVTCVNYVSEDPEGDERAFARTVAARFDCRLVEVIRDSQSMDYRRILSIEPFVRPWTYRYSLEHSQMERQLALECGATATFSGGGGDQVFCNGKLENAVSDFTYLHGIRPGLLAIAWDVARIQKTSFWSVLARVLSTRSRNTVGDLIAQVTELSPLALKQRVDEDWIRRFVTPLLIDQPSDPQGKVWQTLMLSIPTIFYDPLGEDDSPEGITPITSQPVVELALRIPTYVSTFGGWDRAVARRAYDVELPRMVARRRTKGGLSDHSARILQRNMPFIREVLLNGQLLSHDVLDREKVRSLLTSHDAPASIDFLSIEDCLSVEAWLASWGGMRTRAAA